MKLRSRPKMDDPFDGLTGEEVRRIRAVAEGSITPGLEDLVCRAVAVETVKSVARGRTAANEPKRKRGRRA